MMPPAKPTIIPANQVKPVSMLNKPRVDIQTDYGLSKENIE
jgi:hypothetical protein